METGTRERKEVYASLRPAETFMHACPRPTETACLRVQKCANNCQLIVDGIQRFLRYAYAACFRIVLTCKTLHALRIHTQTLIGTRKQWHARVPYTRMKSTLLRWTPSWNDRSKLKGQYTDVQSGCGTSVGPSLNPKSHLKQNSRDTVPLTHFSDTESVKEWRNYEKMA